MRYSVNRITWRAFIKPTTCPECFTRNGRIYSFDYLLMIGEPQLHPNCGCWLEKMQAITAGNATQLGTNGADWWIQYFNELPNYYISKRDAKALGWVNIKGNLSKVAPGYMIFDRYYNSEGKLTYNQHLYILIIVLSCT